MSQKAPRKFWGAWKNFESTDGAILTAGIMGNIFPLGGNANPADAAAKYGIELRNQYLLEYSPTNQVLDGSFRAIKVVVNGFGRPTVRTRNGYYASAAAPAKAPQAATSQTKK